MALSPIELSNIANGIGGFVVNGECSYDLSGGSVATAGDLNGDGFDDLLIGARQAGPNGAGQTYVVFGRSGGFGASIDLSDVAAGSSGFVINGEYTYDRSGISVASAGDVNGDGLADLIIAADSASPDGRHYAGRIHVVFGRSDGIGASLELSDVANGTNGFVIDGQNAYDFAGNSVSSAGDVNGDGLDDLIIGARQAGSAGRSYVVFGRSGGFAAGIDLSDVANGTAGFVINGDCSGDNSGVSVASAGDLNGDGIADLIVGANEAGPAGRLAAGKTYVVFGRSDGFGANIELSDVGGGTGGFVLNGQSAVDRSGNSVAPGGDVNGDGLADLIIGAPYADRLSTAQDSGKTYVLFGKSSGFGTSIDLSAIATAGGFTIIGQSGGDLSGFSVSTAGDLNGDGFDDLLIGANKADPSGRVDAGKTYVVFGKSSTFAATIQLTAVANGTGGFVINGQALLDQSGFSVSAAGDLDGDGFDDLVVGAPVAGISAGKSYVIFGSNLTGAVTQAGTSDPETLTGSAAVDDIVAGLGDDILLGNGGADTLIGGGGDDVIHVSDLTFNRVDGGTGTDTLALDGAGITLDLAVIPGTRIQDIEAVDLTGTGDNTLNLSALQVQNLSTTSNTLTVDGDAGDRVEFTDSGWIWAGVSGGYLRFTNGQATVLANSALTSPQAAVELSNIANGTGGFVINGAYDGDGSGYSVASAGDVNGDGLDDLIIGAPYAAADCGCPLGAAYVVFGRSDGSGAAIALSDIENGTGGFIIAPTDEFEAFGRTVAAAGDINGDGFADVIMGAKYASPGGAYFPGRAYVVFGKSDPFGASVQLSDIVNGTGGFVINGQDPFDFAGSAVASAGDVNGDGFDDLIIGAPEASPSLRYGAGKTFVVFGRSDPFGASVELSDIADGTGGFVINGQDAYDSSGVSVHAAGDINGDGFSDLIIGACCASPDGRAYAGKSYVVFGRSGGFGASIELSDVADGTGGFVINGEQADDNAGFAVSTAGDVDGDGIDDLLVATPYAYGAALSSGRTYVVFGRTDGFAAGIELSDVAGGTGGFVINGEQTDDFAGFSVAGAGDVNGDGFDDLIIGAFRATPDGRYGAGKSYLVFGKSGGFGAVIELSDIAQGTGGFVINGQSEEDKSGFSVSSAGDIDGDGFSDLIVGAFDASPGGTYQAGASYVIHGRDFTYSVTHLGTSASETLTGTSGADDIVAKQGDDILLGNGGADVLIGGAGNDAIHVSDLTFRRVDGGSGTDTLAVDGAGMVLDLGAISSSRIQDVEAIDLTGSGNNTLVLGAREVLNLSGTSNTLTVDGNTGDTLDISDWSGWTSKGSSGGYHTYTNGQATLVVDDEVGVTCFVSGTCIDTDHGAVPVEDLRAGDLVRTVSGETRPIRWIGYRHVDLSRHRNPEDVCPILIRAGALGDQIPARDLRVSPEHAMFLSGGLVPARLLVNGGTIVQETNTRRVSYYHVELDSHDILLAEGAPAESYLDTGNRGLFANGGEPVTLHPVFADGQEGRIGRSCAPFLDRPEAVEPVWQALAEQSVALGYGCHGRPQTTTHPALRILADGRVLKPVAQAADRIVLLLPAGVRDVRLVSRATAPSALRPWVADRRRLGVAVRRIMLRRGQGMEAIPVDHPALTEGWWQPERQGQALWRWTNGEALLPVGGKALALLEIEFGTLGAYAVEAGSVDHAASGPRSGQHASALDHCA